MLWVSGLPDRAWILLSQAKGFPGGGSCLDQAVAVQSLPKNPIDAAGYSVIVPALSARGDQAGTGSSF